MVLKNKIYTTLKWVLATAVAPTITLIEGLGELYKFDTHYITITIALIASFLGALIGYSNYNYKKEGGVKMTTMEEKEVEVTGETIGEEVKEEVKESEGE